jgi:serine/threonine protein phosphatase PrpC
MATFLLDNIGFNHSVVISEHVEQMCKKQDETYSGFCANEDTGEEFYWGMITDGHGGDNVIQFLRSLKPHMNNFVSSNTPVEKLSKHIIDNLGFSAGYRSGATMCLTKCYSDRIECINCGDSQVVVFKNGEIAHISVEHTPTNTKERSRLVAKNARYTKSTSMKITSLTKMIGVNCEYVNFPTGTSLATTQALGHNGMTGVAPDIVTIPFEPSDVIKVVIGSDGLFDMIIKDDNERLVMADVKLLGGMSGEDILKQAVNRWLQLWDIYMPEKPDQLMGTQAFTRDMCDDVSVVVINMSPFQTLKSPVDGI